MTGGFAHRVIALVDMDCFYCQVESRLNPELRGKPVAVVQYNQWKGGGIIAVNYEAKAFGVRRGMRGSQAKEICPDLNLVSVPMLRGKSDLTKYREAGEEVAEIFSDFSDLIQRASIDEAYIDLTQIVRERIGSCGASLDASKLQSTYIVGYSDLKSNNEDEKQAGLKRWLELMNESTTDSPDLHLTVGAMVVEEMREKILMKTGFHCSAGIAHGKILAKLVAGLHKPKHQTILPQDSVPELYHSLPVCNIKSLGGKFGQCVTEKLSVKYMSELYKYSLKELQQKFDEKSGLWLYNIARGIDVEAVTPRLVPDSIGCCKNFPGRGMLRTKGEVEHWIGELSDEIRERLCKDLEKNGRRARLITVSFYQRSSLSRSDALASYETAGIAQTVMELLKRFNEAPPSSDAWDPPIKFLGLSASKFAKEHVGIGRFLINKKSNERAVREARSAATDDDDDDLPGGSFVSCHDEMEAEREIAADDAVPRCSESNDDDDDLETRSKSERPSFFLSFLRAHVDRIEGEAKASAAQEGEEATRSAFRNESSQGGGGGGGDDVSTPATKLCEECNQQVDILDFFEHLDYHVAEKLQAEINGGETRTWSAPLRDVGNKRKRFEGGKSAAKKVKSIKSFFSVVTK